MLEVYDRAGHSVTGGCTPNHIFVHQLPQRLRLTQKIGGSRKKGGWFEEGYVPGMDVANLFD